MSLAKLALKPRVIRTYDSDASSYITAVETADNQSLEQSIRDAITEFVSNCKLNGIWNSIKSCCLFVGPRTQAGAVVPLKGNEPILTNFVGHHTRENGLRRISGFFDTNRNNDDDPQNNKHISIYPSSIDYGISDSNQRSLIASETASGSTFITISSRGLTMRSNTSTNILTYQPILANNLIGISILDSSKSQILFNQKIGISNINTTNPTNGSLLLWSGGGLTSSGSRLAFYSLGENLNLQSLNSVVTKYLQKIRNIILNSVVSLDADAASYISAVEFVDNQYLETSVKNIINNFVIGCKNDNIWNDIKSSCLLIGARTLNGALVPLVGSNPTNNGFNDADYNRKTGLKGNSTNPKTLSSNRLGTDDPRDDTHASVYITEGNIAQGYNYFIGSSYNSAAKFFYGGGSNLVFNINSINAGGVVSSIPHNSLGFIGVTRGSLSNIIIRGNNTSTSVSNTSTVYNSSPITIFGQSTQFQTCNARMCFYSIGENIDLLLLDNNIENLYSSISSIL